MTKSIKINQEKGVESRLDRYYFKSFTFCGFLQLHSLFSKKNIIMQETACKKDLKKAKSNLTDEELTKMVALFNERGYSLTQLDLLDRLKEEYSAKQIVLQLLRTFGSYIEKHDFMNQDEKDELELHFATLTHFTELIKEAA